VPNAKVLVVDDESSVRQALELAFRSEGYEVRTEADGTALADVTRSFRPDVAIVDVRLPVGPDGYTMARMLREDDLPVMVLTAADSLENRLAAFEAGADDHLGKPFSTAELIARTHALLRRSAPRSSRSATSRSTTRTDRSPAAARTSSSPAPSTTC
jgi:two-component system, OmpR family, response regulator